MVFVRRGTSYNQPRAWALLTALDVPQLFACEVAGLFAGRDVDDDSL
jgi:hypothetical protein